jgi:hypothetical protein
MCAASSAEGSPRSFRVLAARPETGLPFSWYLAAMTTLYDALKAALEDLAAPAAKQEADLVSAQVGPDELALELNAYACAAMNLVANGEFSAEAYEAVHALDQHLEAFSGSHNAEQWTMSALHRSANWTLARELALKALALMKG